MLDKAHELTDKLIEELEKKITEEYTKAAKDVQAKLDDYLRRFKVKDEAWQRMVASGEKTFAEYQRWRVGQMAVGKRWEEMRNTIAKDLHNANAIARGIVDGYTAEVYALNMNMAMWGIETSAGINTAFTLYDHDAVARILKEHPELLPPPGKNMLARIAAGQDIKWQEGQLQSVIVQSILQGESIPNMAKRIAQTMGETNHKSTIRYARTAITGAENAGRQDAYHYAEEQGCDMQREWMSVHDDRTRHEHRLLDGQVRGIDEPFEVEGYEIMYPGDPAADPEMIWNCRCMTGAVIKGLEPQARKYRDNTINGMTYDEWKNAKPKSNPIDQQEKIAEAMKWRTIDELYRGK